MSSTHTSQPDQQAPQSPPPGRGRPVDLRKDVQIVKAATSLFMQQGVQGTTMEQIAREAEVSKLTLYRRYPDKNTLFTAVVSEKCIEYMPEEIFDTSTAASPEESLTRLGCGLLELVTSADAVRLNRIITTESAHNPQLTAQFYSSGPGRMKSKTAELMSAFKTQGSLHIDDPAEATAMFVALIVGCEMNKRCNMNMGPAPTRAQIKAYVQRATAFFIRAYSNSK